MIIPVAMMFNNNYAIPSGPAIYSMLKNANKKHFYKLYIMHSDISDNNQNKIKQIVDIFSNASIEFINMNNKLIKYQKFLKYPVEILYKLILASQFPNFDKMIITDVDVVFEGDISDEFINFTTDEYFAGVKYTQEHNHTPFSLNIKDKNCHFIVGAGYLILNLKTIRKDNMEEKFFDYLENNNQYLYCAEQEILSQCCYPNIKLLHPKNMVLTSWYESNNNVFSDFSYTSTEQEHNEALLNPIQIHFVQNKRKPWLNPYAQKSELWYRYLSYTPFFYDHFRENLLISEKKRKTRKDKIFKKLAKKLVKKIKQN